MIKITVVGSHYFQEYLWRIQADGKFSDVQLSYISDRLGANEEDRIREIIREIEQEQPQALVMGIYDRLTVSPHIDIPCYTVSPTIQDFLLIHPHVEDYDNVAVILSNKDNIDIRTLEQCLNIRYHLFYYQRTVEIPELVRTLKKRGFRAIISNRTAVKVAQEIGMTGHYYFSQKTLEDGIGNALQIVQNLEREQRYISEVRSMLDSASCGALYLNVSDASPFIRFINRTALDILRRKESDLVHRPLNQIFPKAVLEQILNCYEPINDVQFSFCGVDIIANIVPMEISIDEKNVCLLFEKTDHILKKESAIRQGLRRQRFNTRYSFQDIKGANPGLKKAIEQAKRFALTDATIYIRAETGAGKEVFAQSIHDHSRRREYPFIAINCASIPDSLIESELFGYMPGAFTGASSKGKQGLIELANHGTIFLDDVDGLSYNVQAKLLRVIQEREIIRIGGDTPTPVDVRFIVATNRNLRQMVDSGEFRNDLYFRINVLPLKIPPLRERKEDILPLYEYYVSLFNYEFYKKIQGIMPDIFRPALQYSYPGNVRELVNIAERFKSLVDITRHEDKEYLAQLVQECLDMKDGQSEEEQGERLSLRISGDYTSDLHQAEQDILQYYVDNADCNMTELAKRLNMSRTTLYSKLKG